MKVNTLTERQKALYDYMESHFKAHGKIPAFRQMTEDLGYASTNSVAQIVEALEKKGWIVRYNGSIRFTSDTTFLTDSDKKAVQGIMSELLSGYIKAKREQGADENSLKEYAREFRRRLSDIL